MRVLSVVRMFVFIGVSVGAFCLPMAKAETASENAATSPPQMMLSVTTEQYDQKSDDGRELDPNTWFREFFRQSVLMVAREEFGMVTRDSVLGEPIDEDSEDCFHLRVRRWKNGHVDIVFRRGETILLETELICKSEDLHSCYRKISERAVIFRIQIFDALADAGFEPILPPFDHLGELPEEIEQLLQKMNHVSQFAALRQLHGLLRKHGECPAILSGLIRGYAHLSQLTMPLVDHRYRGYGARSLVYAARLWALDSDSPVGFWNRGYAMLWIGYPVGVKRGLDAADKRRSDSDIEPPWVELQRLYLGFKFTELTERAEDENYPYREQAALLRLLAARMTASDAFAMDVGQGTREQLPYSQRVITLMLARSGVAAKHELVPLGCSLGQQTLREYLADTNPPKSVLKASAVKSKPASSEGSGLSRTLGQLFGLGSTDEGADPSDDWRGRTMDALWLASEKDLQEPSWSVLASNQRAWHTLGLFQNACFLRYSLGTDATEFVEETVEQMGDEKFRGLYRVIGLPMVSSFEDLNKITEQIDPPEVNNLSVLYDVLMWRVNKKASTAVGNMGDVAGQIRFGTDYLEESIRRSLVSGEGEEYVEWVRWSRNVSEDAPIILSELIRLDWDSVSEDADGWGEEYSECPDIQWALGKHHKHFGDIDKSIEYYERYVGAVDDPRGYIGLSEAWRIKEKSDRWLEVLAMAFDCEDHHLTHASAAAFGGCTLMHEGRYEDALKWTERAAGSYSHWGVSCHIQCLTALGEFEEAEDLARQMSMRYNGTDWYDWCLATGEGDVESAWKAKLDVLRGRGAEKDHRWSLEHGYHLLMFGEEELAEKKLLQVSQPPHAADAPESAKAWCNLFAALLADRRGDGKARDSLLMELAQTESEAIPARSVAAVAKWIHDDKGSGRISEEEIAELTAVGGLNGFFLQGDIASSLAFYLYSHDNKETAVKLWSDTAKRPNGWARNTSWHWLRNAGVDPIHLPDRNFSRLFRSKQQKDVAKKI